MLALHRVGLLGNLAARRSASVALRALSGDSSSHYKVVVVGGGSGGIAVAAKLSRQFPQGSVAVIEPAEMHFYQPMWTLVGGGAKNVSQSEKRMQEVMPKKCVWIKNAAKGFEPENNAVVTASGEKIGYDYLLVAMGIQLNFDKVKGLVEALEADPSVCSNYSRKTVEKTFKAIQNFNQGNAVFTFPNTPIKCAGAPQKIMYLAEDYFRKNNKRDKANILYNSSLGVIFGVKKYAAELSKICSSRGIQVNLRHNLVEVNHQKKEATFALLDSETGETATFNYEMLHVTPPMSPPDVIKSSSLADAATGFLDVVKETGQHVNHPNIFGIGDCTNIPTAKTAAGVAAQSGVVFESMNAVMKGNKPVPKYDGYTSCPLITGYGKTILAEFDFDLQPLETFPVDQGKERRTMYHLKKDVMPQIYWQGLLKGYWNGPKTLRKVMRLGM